MNDVEMDPLVRDITAAFASAGRALDEEGLAALADRLGGLAGDRAERICAQLVAIALRLLQADGERAVEVVVQLQVLAELAVGGAAAVSQFEAVERAFPGLRTERALPSAPAPMTSPDGPPAPKVRRGLARET